MPAKPHSEMKGVSPERLKDEVARNGAPDYFIESAEVALVGMPDVDDDPETKALVDNLEEKLGISHNGTNGGDPANETAEPPEG